MMPTLSRSEMNRSTDIIREFGLKPMCRQAQLRPHAIGSPAAGCEGKAPFTSKAAADHSARAAAFRIAATTATIGTSAASPGASEGIMQAVLHNPRAQMTESQRKAADALVARRSRLNGISAREQRLAVETNEKALSSMVDAMATEASEIVSPEDWVDRQKRLHPLPAAKATWFSIEDAEPRRPRIEEIQVAIAKHYHVRRDDILSARRTASIVLPRQVGYYLSKMLTMKSLPEIGRRFGNRDHTSALSGIRKIERLRQVDADLESDLHTIAAAVGGSLAETP